MNMEVEAARVIEAINHVPIRLEKGAEQFDMCKAIEEMIEDGRQERRVCYGKSETGNFKTVGRGLY